MGVVICGCFDNCVGILVICVLVFTVFLHCFVHVHLFIFVDGFGGLVVSMLASVIQVCGFKPGRSLWIFTGVKILSMPSSGGEVK